MARSSALLLLFLAASLSRWQVSATRGSCVTQESAYHRAEQRQAKPDTLISIQIAISAPNVEGPTQSLLDISDPASPNYGRHWTARQVAQAFAPDPQHVQTVISWLNSSGVHPSRLMQSHGKGYLRFNTTVREGRRVLNTNFRHAIDGQLTCDTLQLPERVIPAIDFVVAASLNHTSAGPSKGDAEHIRRRRQQKLYKKAASATVVNCTKYMAPSCLRDLYRIPSGNTPHPNNSFGIYEISWQTWLPDDLDMFFTMFQPNIVGQRPVVEAINGGYCKEFFRL
jgi:tripeptidyl-peptidase-1